MAEETLTRPLESSPAHPEPRDAAIGESQGTNMLGSQQPPTAAYEMFSVMYPPFLPGVSPFQNQDESGHGHGIYAIPQHPFMGPMGGYPPGALIPLKYKIPTESSGAVAGEEQQGQEPRQPQQQNGPQRQVVVRRFHFAFQLDLGLIIKLAAVVFLFSQEGSKQKFILLVFFASLVYLYQTGALAPLLRWIRRGVAVPPPQPPVRLENRILAGHDNRNDMPPEGEAQLEAFAPAAPREAAGKDLNEQQLYSNAISAPAFASRFVERGLKSPQFGAEENHEDENPNPNENQNTGDEEPPVAANENRPEPERRNGVNWWGIVREVQMFVVGFVTSLLPGFQHND